MLRVLRALRAYMGFKGFSYRGTAGMFCVVFCVISEGNTVNPKMLETLLGTNSAGIPYTLRDLRLLSFQLLASTTSGFTGSLSTNLYRGTPHGTTTPNPRP